MPGTVTITRDQLFAEEEKIKESVYNDFQTRIADANRDVEKAIDAKKSDNYEAQFRSLYASDLEKEIRSQHQLTQRITSLYKKPYFSHIKLIQPNEDNHIVHCLLSDCPELENAWNIKSADEETIIIPFKKDEHQMLFDALFSVYQAKTGEPFDVKDQTKDRSVSTYTTYRPQLIRDVDIISKAIQNVQQYFPKVELTEIVIDFDDILALRLDENRNNAQLRNIISTLQREQYGIVQTPENVSFVVQGCAGSGKSQCLIHRLFYLRANIAEQGWDKVLLITPSQLFRNYSSELMTRFHLKNIKNTSISDFYRTLLSSVDNRFKNRQYRFELSEEYLPDGYLHEVYSRSTIEKIRTEIKNAIRKYVTAACNYLNIPDREQQITTDIIAFLIGKLDSEIAGIRLQEMKFSKDKEYNEKRSESDSFEAEIVSLRKNQERNIQRKNDLLKKKEELDKYINDIEAARNALQEWSEEYADRVELYRMDAQVATARLDTVEIRFSNMELVNDYLKKTGVFLNATCEWGDIYQKESEYESFLLGYIELCQEELDRYLKGKSLNEVRHTINKDLSKNSERLDELEDKINALELQIENNMVWLETYTKDVDVRNRNKTRLDGLESTRYALSRIESTVFEREVWDALLPLKRQYNIKTIDEEMLQTGRKRETRILYKSDLLFYLRIYMALHETANIPEYNYICIDEGQDLHEADYETLKELYPTTVFNVFGDVDQALYVDCGIKDWSKETGINKTFELNKNYRNTPAVVSFIKEKFGAKMEPCGDPKKGKYPVVIHKLEDLKQYLEIKDIVVIVKDRTAFYELRDKLGYNGRRLNYIDTNSTEEKQGYISCFSVFAAKGLEYPNVIVYAAGMNHNQKVVACSRSLNHLYYYECEDNDNGTV